MADALAPFDPHADPQQPVDFDLDFVLETATFASQSLLNQRLEDHVEGHPAGFVSKFLS